MDFAHELQAIIRAVTLELDRIAIGAIDYQDPVGIGLATATAVDADTRYSGLRYDQIITIEADDLIVSRSGGVTEKEGIRSALAAEYVVASEPIERVVPAVAQDGVVKPRSDRIFDRDQHVARRTIRRIVAAGVGDRIVAERDRNTRFRGFVADRIFAAAAVDHVGRLRWQ